MSTNIPLTVSRADATVDGVKQHILQHLTYSLARDAESATKRDWWSATSKVAMDHLLERLIRTQTVHNRQNVRRVYYLSLEFLIGRLLSNNLLSSGIYDQTEQALKELGLDINELRDEEYDMGLGNGGLGRLAACFLDSLATHDYPAVGYGIHYEFGLFRQEFVNGHQVEHADQWLMFGDNWEIVRPEYTQTVQLYGRVENIFDTCGNYKPRWVDTQVVLGIPYDIPIAGYETGTVNFLRLWESKSPNEFDFSTFNQGGFINALRDKNMGETISKVLYPNDTTENGKELRLVQQYFFVSCSLHDIIRRFLRDGGDWSKFPERVAIQLNDTHPAIAVAELMRILHDENEMPWEEAWDIVTRTFAYTNHTLLPEALEKWSLPMFEKVLPRHVQIILEINKRFLDMLAVKWPDNSGILRDLSIIEEGYPKMIRMAHLAVVGSHTVNGVAALHTELLKKNLFSKFDELYPGKIQNKTNGVTPRRWILSSNARLSRLITSRIGTSWVKNLDHIRGLEPLAHDPAFLDEFMAVKHANKTDLARFILNECGVEVNPAAIYDVHIKRLHEYKRQHLNLLHILTLYRRLLQNPELDIHPRVFLFAAKAAPGYTLAKNIIKAINAVSTVINADTRIHNKLKVVFLPNYRVSLASKIIPAADVSEQISTAGKEASGTGNMKLALNGAVTIGTLDGANVEILEEVGSDNIFIFGHTVEEIEALRARGYHPWEYYHADAELRAVIDWIGSNFFTPDEGPDVFAPLKHSLLDGGDPFFVLADYRAYCEAQEKLGQAYRDRNRWGRMALLNVARCNKFSSDRTIRQYAEEIWNLPPVHVP